MTPMGPIDPWSENHPFLSFLLGVLYMLALPAAFVAAVWLFALVASIF